MFAFKRPYQGVQTEKPAFRKLAIDFLGTPIVIGGIEEVSLTFNYLNTVTIKQWSFHSVHFSPEVL